jgi:hypothetical protein
MSSAAPSIRPARSTSSDVDATANNPLEGVGDAFLVPDRGGEEELLAEARPGAVGLAAEQPRPAEVAERDGLPERVVDPVRDGQARLELQDGIVDPACASRTRPSMTPTMRRRTRRRTPRRARVSAASSPPRRRRRAAPVANCATASDARRVPRHADRLPDGSSRRSGPWPGHDSSEVRQ